MTKPADGFWPKCWRIFKRVFLILFISQFVYIIILKWVNPPVTLTQLGSLITGHGLKRDYVSGKNMSPWAKLAVMASEDQLFPDHDGFDWKSIEKAMAYNKKKPNRVRGASTISQQVAKNVFLWQGRGWIRKGLEVYFTFMIEHIWGKKRILEMYLNIAEMGDGVFGIEAAAQKNFKKPAKNLSRTEAAMIAASLPNPKKFTVVPMSKQVAIRYPWILRQMPMLAGDEDVQKIISEPEKTAKTEKNK
jgi:monofunctional biosynthetic peptidoglycan transglycosylase